LLRDVVLRRPRGAVRGGGGERQGDRTRRPRPGHGQAARGPRPLAVLPRPPPGRLPPAHRALTVPVPGARARDATRARAPGTAPPAPGGPHRPTTTQQSVHA